MIKLKEKTKKVVHVLKVIAALGLFGYVIHKSFFDHPIKNRIKLNEIFYLKDKENFYKETTYFPEFYVSANAYDFDGNGKIDAYAIYRKPHKYSPLVFIDSNEDEKLDYYYMDTDDNKTLDKRVKMQD